MKVSLCVHSYNEADALGRLIRSSYPVADLVREWVVVDHRSDDHTGEVVGVVGEELRKRGVGLRFHREDRGLSRAFTFADVRGLTLRLCTEPVLALFDADMILTSSFRSCLTRSLTALLPKRSPYWGAGCTIPVVWDHLQTDKAGMITDHGRVWVHSNRPRFLMRDCVEVRQDGNGGRWEAFYPTKRTRNRRLNLTRNRPHAPRHRVAYISCNVKPQERIDLRDTMTFFMEDTMQGKIDGEWVEQFKAGTLRKQPPYDFTAASLRGWTIHAPNLSLP